MKFGLMFANTGAFVEPDQCEVLATTAESVGIESIWTVEHVVIPVEYASEYPYNRSGRLPGGAGASIADPIVWMSFVAAITKTIRLGTGILILPQRHPVYVAKEFATLDRLSGGRAMLGVGIGWLEEEFNVVGVPFAQRAARTEESIQALRSLWSAGQSVISGEHYRWNAVESNPKPVQTGGVPIIVGGHVPAAARRAARYGDGFFPGRLDSLDELLAVLHEECKVIGRDSTEIEITTGAPRLTPEAIEALAVKGVSRIILPPPGRNAEEIKAGLETFAEDVLSKVS